MSSLPDDLKQRGWKLIARAPDRIFAVSLSWGCTKTCDKLEDVITIARNMSRWCEAMNRRRRNDDNNPPTGRI